MARARGPYAGAAMAWDTTMVGKDRLLGAATGGLAVNDGGC